MAERRPRIAVDMDDVIAHTIDRFAEIYRKEHKIDLTSEILHGKEIREVLPDNIKHTVSEYVNAPGFFQTHFRNAGQPTGVA